MEINHTRTLYIMTILKKDVFFREFYCIQLIIDLTENLNKINFRQEESSHKLDIYVKFFTIIYLSWYLGWGPLESVFFSSGPCWVSCLLYLDGQVEETMKGYYKRI